MFQINLDSRASSEKLTWSLLTECGSDSFFVACPGAVRKKKNYVVAVGE